MLRTKSVAASARTSAIAQPPKPAPVIRAPKAGRIPPGTFDHRVQRVTGNLKIVAQTLVTFVHQPAKLFGVAPAHRLGGAERAVVFGDDMQRAATRDVIKPIGRLLKLFQTDIAHRANAEELRRGLAVARRSL